jgi:hypothetical protein
MNRHETAAAVLKWALERQDRAFREHDGAAYGTAANDADMARLSLAAMPGLTWGEVAVKSKALGPMPASGLAYCSEGEAALAASILRDTRRLAEVPALAAA